MRRSGKTAAAAGLAALVLTAGVPAALAGPGSSARSALPPPGIRKIRHVVVIMQENRSFDSYFGTFPGADGIPMRDGAPSVCVPDPQSQACDRPYPDHADVNGGGPHSQSNAIADINGGKMDGRVDQAEAGRPGRLNPAHPTCTNSG